MAETQDDTPPPWVGATGAPTKRQKPRWPLAYCDDCHALIKWVEVPGTYREKPSKWQPHSPDGAELHYLTCTGERSVKKRIREGLVPGIYPVSISRLLLWRRCRRAYALRYGLGGYPKLLEPVAPDQEVGRAFHAYAAARVRGLEPPAYTPPMEMAEDWKRFIDTFESQTWDWEYLVGTEEVIETEWTDGAMTVRLISILDALSINGGFARVDDWKTGFDFPNVKEMRENIQLKSYALAVFEEYPQVTEIRAQVIPLRFFARGIGVTWHRGELDAFRESLHYEMGQMLRDAEYLPTAGCGICPPGAHADAHAAIRGVRIAVDGGEINVTVGPIETQEQAVELARAAKFCEDLAKAIKYKQLKAWSDEHGPIIATATGGYGHWPTEKRSIEDTEKAIKVLQANGHNPFNCELCGGPHVYVSMGSVSKLLKGRKEIPELTAMLNYETSTKFDWKKVAKAPPQIIGLEEEDVAVPVVASDEAVDDPVLTVIEGGVE